MTEIHLAALETDPAAPCHRDRLVVKGIRELLQASVDARRSHVEVGRHFHAQGLMRSVAIEALDERIEAGLLSQDIRAGWFRRFPFQREVHPLMPPVLLWVARRDAFQLNAQAEPPDRQFAQPVERVPGREG